MKFFPKFHKQSFTLTFTKLMKPLYSSLRSKGLVSSGYLDDSFLVGDTKDCCLNNVQETIDMTVTLAGDKTLKLHKVAMAALSKDHCTIPEVASLTGLHVSCTPGVQYVQLFYKQLEIDKAQALRAANGNFDSAISLSSIAITDIHWWLEHATKCKIVYQCFNIWLGGFCFRPSHRGALVPC